MTVVDHLEPDAQRHDAHGHDAQHQEQEHGAAHGAEHGSTRGFWIGAALGSPIIALGIRGAVVNARDTHPAELGRWIAGSAVLHDALVLPVVAAIAFLGRRVVVEWAWPSVRWALMTSAILLVVSRPFVAGYGYNPQNPTALPRNYGLGVAVALVVVWAVAAIWALLLRRQAGHRRWNRKAGRRRRSVTG